MKKSLIGLSLLLLSALAMAGGDCVQNMSPVTAIPSSGCKEDKVYRDKKENLLWQDQSYTEAENGAVKRHQSIGKAGSYRHAIRYCQNLQYAGYADWRLPTSDELTSVHYPQGEVFTYFRDTDFWSSTPATEGKYYVVYPADAIRYARPAQESNYIRCVRCIMNDK